MEPSLETLVKIITALVALFGLFKGIMEYRKAQQWKRAEFLAKEIKEFNADPDVRRMYQVLDWNAYDIELRDKEIPGQIYLSFNDDLFFESLRHHSERETEYSHEEAVMRGIIDKFFDKLAMFQYYIEGGLIDKKDVRNYLGYWLEILGDPNCGRKPAPVIYQLWRYLEGYNYAAVIRLLRSLGYTVRAGKRSIPETV